LNATMATASGKPAAAVIPVTPSRPISPRFLVAVIANL